jgi:tetratricopeptide (TPR) repeat protein
VTWAHCMREAGHNGSAPNGWTRILLTTTVERERRGPAGTCTALAASSEWQKAAAIEPGQAGIHERLARAYRHAARLDEAEEEARRTMRLAGVTRDVGCVDLALFTRGTARWLETAAAPGPDARERRAALYASVGDRDRALAALEAACNERSRFLLRHLGVDPDLDALAGDERYQALLKRVGLSG